MALTYVLKTNPGNRYVLDGNALLTAADLVQRTDQVVVTATDGNGWSKNFTIDVEVGPAPPPVFNYDLRQDLSGAIWTSEGSATYSTVVTFRDTLQQQWLNGPTPNSTHFQVWRDLERLEWRVGGADIAANVASVKANAGSFTIHRNGSTAQDPRSDTVGQTFKIYVHLADEAPPAGQPMKIADRLVFYQLVGASDNGPLNPDLDGDVAIGNLLKDAMQTAIVGSNFSGRAPYLKDVYIYDVPVHGSVGPIHTLGTHTVRGRVVPGSAIAAKGMNLGGLVNTYTNVARPTETLTFATLDLAFGTTALYGHGSGNVGYAAMEVGHLKVRRCSNAVKFDRKDDATPFTPNLTIQSVDIEGVDIGFEVHNLTVNGGRVVMNDENTAVNPIYTALINNYIPGAQVHLTDVDFTFRVNGNPNSIRRALAGGGCTLILEACNDLSAPALAGHLVNLDTNGRIDLVLTGGTQVGDLQHVAHATRYYPKTIRVDAGCRFGFGDRTGPQIVAWLEGLGVATANISRNTTIVNRSGVVKSAPGW